VIEQLNWLAIILATLVSMGLGAAWYTVLAKQWITASGFSKEQIKSIEANDKPAIYAIAAICHLIMALVLSGIVFHAGGSTITTGDGLLTGFLVWLGFVATSMTVNHRFQFKPWSLTAIDSGHYLLILLAQGAIVGWFGF
jgi:TRAP-type C4-dicarboxylate transport system permease small subunit